MALLAELHADGATIVVITHERADRRGAAAADRAARRAGGVRQRLAGRGAGMSALAPSRIAAADIVRTGALGLRTRRLRAALSALGIAIGIASMVAVLGISESSKADLLAAARRARARTCCGSRPGSRSSATRRSCPTRPPRCSRRVGGVERVAAVRNLDGVTVRRNDLVDPVETGGIAVAAADPALARTVAARPAQRALPRRRHRALSGGGARRRRGRPARDRRHRLARVPRRALVHA